MNNLASVDVLSKYSFGIVSLQVASIVGEGRDVILVYHSVPQ